MIALFSSFEMILYLFSFFFPPLLFFYDKGEISRIAEIIKTS